MNVYHKYKDFKYMNFTLNEKEQEEYNKFVKKHESCEFPSSIGGKISLTFTGTGLGDIIEVRCNCCGKTKDITDISNW